MSPGKSDGIDPELIVMGLVITVGVAFLTVFTIANSFGRNVATFFMSVGAPPETATSVGGITMWVVFAAILLLPVLGYLKWR